MYRVPSGGCLSVPRRGRFSLCFRRCLLSSGSLSLQLALLFQAHVGQTTGLFFYVLFLNNWSIFPWQGLKCSFVLCMTMVAAIFGDACWQSYTCLFLLL